MVTQQDLDFININKAYAAPILKKVYAFIVKNSELSLNDKNKLYDTINLIEPDFVKPAGISLVDDNGIAWFVYLDECSRDHDFRTQLDKIKFQDTSTYNESGKLVTSYAYHKMETLKDNIFSIYKAVTLFYNVYSIKHEELVDQLNVLYNYNLDVDKLQLNKEWQLFISEAWIDRIGLFVKEVN